MKCWKCGSEIVNNTGNEPPNCPYCNASQNRNKPITGIGKALRETYDHFGCNAFFGNGGDFAVSFSNVFPELKSTENEIAAVMKAGVGKLYLDQLELGKWNKAFKKKVKEMMTVDAGLSDKRADEMIRLFDEMIGWKEDIEAEHKSKRFSIKTRKWVVIISVAVVFLVGGLVFLFNRDKKSAEDKEQNALTDETTNQDTQALKSAGIRAVVRMDKFEGKKGISKDFVFERNGEVFTTRNTAKYTLLVQSIPDDVKITDAVWETNFPECLQITGDRLFVKKEIPDGEDAFLKVSTKDGKHSIVISVITKHAGWNKIDGEYYLIRGDEEILRNSWWTYDGDSRYVDGSGKAVQGWQQLRNKQGEERAYYFDPHTKWLVKNKTIKEDFGECLLNDKGELVNSWLYLNNKWYYYDETGTMIKGTTIKIAGKSYTFSDDGTTDR